MKKITLYDVILLCLSVLLALGSHFLFHACNAKPDGSWMNCHYVQHVLTALGTAFSLLCVCRLLVSDSKIKTGISICFFVFAIFGILLPGTLLRLCMMHDMRCHTIMRPSASLILVLIMVVSIIDIISSRIMEKK